MIHENETGFNISGAPFLHVFPQHSWHSPATIRGNIAALKALRDAIDAAIEKGEASARAFATDGEGYEILIERCATMAHIGEPFYAMQEIVQGVLREGQYEARFKLQDTVQLTRKAFDELREKAGLPPSRTPFHHTAPSPLPARPAVAPEVAPLGESPSPAASAPKTTKTEPGAQ